MSPSTPLARFLSEMEYPATKDDLLREATRDGLDRDDILALERLDGHSYSARWQVLWALRSTPPAERTLVAA